jgi:hypothetical protein
LDAVAWIIFAASPAHHPYSASKLTDFDSEVCSIDDELAGHVCLQQWSTASRKNLGNIFIEDCRF